MIHTQRLKTIYYQSHFDEIPNHNLPLVTKSIELFVHTIF
jgi:hypothetical protein